MQVKDLRLKRALRTALLVLLLSAVGMGKMYAYDFSAVCETGQTLYYKFTGSGVALTYPNSSYPYWEGFTKPAGDIVLPESVQYNGVVYTVTRIDERTFYGCSDLTGSLTIPNSVTMIGQYAFHGCSGFTGSLIIGNSVNSIGSDAFFGCGGFSFFTVLSETPPYYGYQALQYLSSITHVYVPCGFEEAYASLSWGGFSNFEGLCGGMVTVIASPEEGGTVTGGGMFGANQTCTVTATANEGYAFVNWTYNGVIVSRNETYTTNVVGDMTLIAHFASENNITFADANVKTVCVSHWDTNGDNELSYAEAASVTSLSNYFQNNSEITSFVELQYFIGLSSIGYYAFYGCVGLTSIELPSFLTSLEDAAFCGCTGLTSIAIPNSVTYIRMSAFGGCTGLTSIDIPNSVTTIGPNAFSQCSGLISIEIPTTVTSIGENPFVSCSSLEQIIVDYGNTVYDSRENCNALIKTNTNELISGCKNTVIPNSVTTIGGNSFTGCSGLTSIEIPNSVSTIGYGAFTNCRNMVSIVIPNSVISIEHAAFHYCSSLNSIAIPESVTSINDWTFYGCASLTFVNLGNSVTSIGNKAFYNCHNLASLTIFVETPPILGDDVFYNVNTSIPIYVPCASLSAYQNASGWNVFTNIQEQCLNISFADANVKALCVANWDTDGDGELSYDEAAAVTDLGEVFSENTEITSFEELQYFTGLTSINSYAFYNCSNLSGSLYIPSSVTTIGEGAFYGCNGFTSMTVLVEMPPLLGSNVFYNVNKTILVFVACGASSAYQNALGWSEFTNIQEYGSCPITFADANVKAICVANWDTNGDGELSYDEAVAVTDFGEVFRENTEITSFEELQYFTGLTSISNYAFYNCNNLSGSLYIPNSVTMIGSSAFDGCSGFTGDLYIPNSVTEIGDWAFADCYGFTGGLTISNSVTTIGVGVFYDCGFTGNLVIPNSVTEIGADAFFGCGFTGSLTIPNSVTTIGQYAFINCGFIGLLTIPDSVTSIGNSAFQGCNGFTGDLVIPSSVTEIGEWAFSGCSGFTGCLTIPDSVTTIGGAAFSGCSGFIGSLTIPNSVTTIGYAAFYGCSGFSFITNLAETPPTCYYNTFSTWSANTLVYVPCNYVDAYASLSWGGFSNFIGLCGGTVTVSAVPEEGGMATGSGSFDAGQTCTVSATANEGYIFNNWTLNEANISTNAEYTFYVAGEMSLVAHFVPDANIVFADNNVKNICVAHWDTDYDGELSYVEAARVTHLGTYFRNNSNITAFDELYYFTGLSSIENSAFYNCSGLNSIALPYSVNEIRYNAFNNCSGLNSITLPYSVNEIEYGAFFNCTGLTRVNYTGDIAQWCHILFTDNFSNPLGYAHNLYIDNSLVTNLYIPETIKEIKNYAFQGCSSFTGSLTIPSSVTSIGNFAFSGCSGFTGNLIIPDSVTYLSGFDGCAGFTGELIIPNSVTEIGEDAFFGCSGFTGSLTIPNSVTTIGRQAFRNCSGLTGGLTIPDSVTSIGSGAFWDCSGFTGNLTISNSVTEINIDAFYGCSGFTGSLTIPNSVTTIGYRAFRGCSGLTGVLTIPISVTSIGYQAFSYCNGFTEIMILGTNPPSLEGYQTFGFSDSSVPIYVPFESLNEYKTATNWSNYESRIFPMAYTTIPGYGEGEGNYRFIASPLMESTNPTTVDNMITETPYDLYRFDQSEDAEWQNYKFPENTPNFFLTNGQGYLYANAEDVNLIFKGEFNEDETKEVELAYDADADFAGWNLVGNPFPVSAYANKSYYTMNEDGTAVEPNMVSSATAIPACTGVMVKAEAQGETIVFNTTTPETASNKGCVQIALSQVVDRGGVSTSSTTLQDKVIVSFNAGDRLEKFVFNKDNARISIPQGGKDLAIACAEKQGEIPINFKATKNGTYTLCVDVEKADVDYLYLIDNLTGADVDLLVEPNYTFTAKTTDYASRFRLVFNVNETDGPSTGSGTFAFINNGNIIVTGAEADAMLQIVDVLGHIIVSTDVARNVSTNGMTPGVYILRLINGNDIKTQKIVID